MLNRFFPFFNILFSVCAEHCKKEKMQRSVQIVWVHCCLLWSQVFLLHYMKWKLMHKWMRNENTTWKYCCYIPIFLLCPLFVSLLCTSFHFFHSIPCDCLVSNHFFSMLCVFSLRITTIGQRFRSKTPNTNMNNKLRMLYSWQ